MSRAAVMRPMDEAAAAGQLALQRCTQCGAGQYPPRELCRVCLSGQLEWSVSTMVAGEVLAVTTVCHSFEAGTVLPQRVGLVRLEPGVTAVCFLADTAAPGPVAVRAALDAAGRAVLTAC